MNGFKGPNYTQVPNELFELLPLMREAELKVVLHAVRQTLGYHRDRDAISLSQFEKATGLSRPGVVSGIAAAIERGVLKEVGTGTRGLKSYALIIEAIQDICIEVVEPENLLPAIKPVNEVDQLTQLTSTSQPSLLELVNSVNTQKKERKSKEKNDDDDAGARAKEFVDDSGFNIFNLYHQTFGRLVANPILADDLKDMAASYPHDWITDAFKQAALANASSHKYALTCLQAWQTHGRKRSGPNAPPKPGAAGGSKPGASPPPDPRRTELITRLDQLTVSLLPTMPEMPPPDYLKGKPEAERVQTWRTTGRRATARLKAEIHLSASAMQSAGA